MCECTCNSEGPFTPEDVSAALGKTYRYSLMQHQPDWAEVFWKSDANAIATSIGNIKVVETEGGSDDEGHAHLVIQTERSGQLFKIDGYYSSYDGLTVDGNLREVHETIKTVKVYE